MAQGAGLPLIRIGPAVRPKGGFEIYKNFATDSASQQSASSEFDHSFRTSSGNLAMFAAIRRASSLLSSLAADSPGRAHPRN
jgi:hypothetical protein